MSARFFLIWLCVVSSVFGGENFEPKDALLFVEGLKSQEVIDWDDYVLASHLDELQLKELKERVKAQVDERFKEDYEFSILDSRQDGDIGGVIFKLKSPSDPVFLDVVGLSFCRLGEDWKITPLMGRYIYTGFKLYNEEAEKRQKLMEDWILRNLRKQRSLLEGKLENDFRKEILAKLDKEGPLFKGSRDEALLYFLSLCKKKDFYGLAGCLGLDDFEGRSGYTEAKLSLLDGFKGGKNSGGWHRLVDKIYLMAPMEKVGDEDDKVSLAMYYPLESDPQQILEMDVKKINDRWIVFLSKEMLLRSTGRFGSTRFGSWRLSKENRDRLEDVSSLILKSLKSKRSEKVEDLLSKLEASLKGNDIKLWCEIGNFDFDDNDKALLALDESVSMWTGLRTSKNTVMKVLKTDVDGGVAFNHLLVFSKTRPNEHELHRLIFIRGEQGWFLATEKWIDELEADDVVSKNYEALLALQNDREEEFKKEVSRSLLGEAVIINGEEAVKFSMPRKGELIKKYKEYQFSLAKGDYLRGLKNVAVLDGQESELLGSIGADMRGAMDNDAKYEVVGEFSSKLLGGVGVKVTNKRTSDTEYIMYGVHQVGDDYFLMPTVLYRYEFGRGDRILNKNLDEGFGTVLDGRYNESLKILVEKHKELVDGILKKK